jgi:dipeptidyl aminopeptidase/acylaminoacyl peptidase
VYVGSLDSTDVRRVFEADAAPVFAAPDFVLFAREGTLLAQRLDLARIELVGDPVPVSTRVVLNPGTFNAVAVSASSTGSIAYRASPASRRRVWLDRVGRQIATVGDPDAGQPTNPRLSPDGQTLALTRTVAGNTDVWLIDLERGVPRRLTFDAVREANPVWSPDGRRIAFASERTGVYDLYEKSVDGAARETLLVASSQHKSLWGDWSPDGGFIVYSVQDPTADNDLWVLPLGGEGLSAEGRKPFVFAQTPFNERDARFSPDGRWIAYNSEESGQYEVYVQPFPGPGRRVQVSIGGGRFPEWRRDGRELFYLAPDSRVTAVPMTLTSSAAMAGTPVPLFAAPPGTPFVVTADGQRFLVSPVAEPQSPLTLVLNWAGAVRK